MRIAIFGQTIRFRGRQRPPRALVAHAVRRIDPARQRIVFFERDAPRCAGRARSALRRSCEFRKVHAGDVDDVVERVRAALAVHEPQGMSPC